VSIFGMCLIIKLTNKGGKCQKETIISENNKLIIKQDEVSELFNNFFVNVAKKHWQQ